MLYWCRIQRLRLRKRIMNSRLISLVWQTSHKTKIISLLEMNKAIVALSLDNGLSSFIGCKTFMFVLRKKCRKEILQRIYLSNFSTETSLLLGRRWLIKEIPSDPETAVYTLQGQGKLIPAIWHLIHQTLIILSLIYLLV